MQKHVTGLFFNILSESVDVCLNPDVYVRVDSGSHIPLQDMFEFSVYIPSELRSIKVKGEKYFYAWTYYNEYYRPAISTIDHIQNYIIPTNHNNGIEQPFDDTMIKLLTEKYAMIKQYNTTYD